MVARQLDVISVVLLFAVWPGLAQTPGHSTIVNFDAPDSEAIMFVCETGGLSTVQ
jgi:hypothetical protein